MVKVMLRAIQKIKNWAKLEPYNKKMTDIETKLGMPAKRRYRAMAGPNTDTLVIEWEFKSMAVYEESLHAMMGSPEHLKGLEEGADIVGEITFEVFMLWPPQF